MNTISFRPLLRELEISALQRGEDEFLIMRDREGFSETQQVPIELGSLLALMDGTRDINALVEDYARRYGENLPRDWVESIVSQMDEALLLDSPHFSQHQRDVMAQWNDASARPVAFADRSYPANPEHLRQYLNELFAAARELEQLESKPLASTCSGAQGRGIVVPHIDFGRGGRVEALAYRALLRQARQQPFDTLIILGIAHSGVHYPFCATAKDFQTPLGLCRTDREFVRALQDRVGPRLKAEQWTHKNEHSIEFVTTFLAHLDAFASTQIVPILCGGFFAEIRSGRSPLLNPDISQFVEALRGTTQRWESGGKRVGFIASVDGAHVGSPFGDDTPITPQRLAQIATDDGEFWQTLEAGNLEALHAHMARDDNARHVDAHPAVYTLLAAFPSLRAQMLFYDQAFSEERNELVSFAALELCEAKGEG